MHLSVLPTEILTDIVEYLTALPITALWISGDKLIQRKLGAEGGVKRFVLHHPELLRITWPSIVAVFPRLVCFDLSDLHDSETLRIHSKELLTLPKTVTDISLNFAGALPAFREAFMSSQGESRYESLVSLTICDRTTREQWDSEPELLLWPRNLTSLWISTNYRTVLDISSLPMLVKLKGQYHLVNLDAGLPKTLRSLEIMTDEAGSVMLQLNTLPLLERCSVMFWTDVPGYELNEISLPAKVKVVDLPFSHYSAELLQMLPPSVESIQSNNNYFDTYSQDIELVPHLPPRVKDPYNVILDHLDKDSLLLFQSRQVECLNGSVDMLPHFPHSVLRAILSGETEEFRREMTDLGLKKLPLEMKLQEIIYRTMTGPFGDADTFFIAALPDSLETLHVSFTNIPTESVKLLPKRLLTLGNYDGPLCDPSDWSLLPRHLTFLSASVPIVDTLDSNTSLLLPRTLKHLYLIIEDGTSLGKDWFDGLPKQLETINIRGRIKPVGDDWNLSLSTSLKSFYVDFAALPPGGFRAIFKSMPRMLESLTLHLDSPRNQVFECELVEKDFSYLPRYALTTLHVPTCRHLTASSIAYLPKTLLQFVIGNPQGHYEQCSWFTPYFKRVN